MTEVAVSTYTHIKHRYERRTYDPVEYPLERYCYRNSLTTYCVREYLSNKNPAYRSPRHHKRCAVEHDAYHRYNRIVAKTNCHASSSYRHTQGTGDEKWLTTSSFNCKYGHQCERDID